MQGQPRTTVVVGIGQLGSEFARGLLRLGCAVYPVTRTQSVAEIAEAAGLPELVLVAVGEAALGPLLESVPARFRGRVGLVQNELVPRDWKRAGIEDPSGIVVWFEKKAGRAVHEVRPSVVYGPKCALLLELLRELGVSAYSVSSRDLEFELALKNLYILVHNLAGLNFTGPVGELWQGHADWALSVADDVFAHQEALLGHPLDRSMALEKLAEAVRADPGHACAGRSAPERLKRVLSQARELGLRLPTLERLGESSDA